MTTTSPEQFEILIEFMEKNEGIAKNFLNSIQFKETTIHLWAEVKERLNSAGPPEKNVDGWKKVWRDFKYNTKNKLRANKKSISGTGGGPCRIKRLTTLEERVNVLLDLRGEIEGINAKSFGCDLQSTSVNGGLNNINLSSQLETTSTNISNNEQINEELQTETAFQPVEDNTTQLSRPQRACKPPKETSKTLLKKQLQMQENFFNKQEKYFKKQESQKREIIRTLKEIRDTEKQKLSLKLTKLSFEEEKWKAKQAIYLDKIKQKAELLEIKKTELELRKLEFEAQQ